MATAELIDLKGPKNNNTRTKYLPVVKHVVPLCEECQTDNAPENWWSSCDHDPYFSMNPLEIPGEIEYEDIPNEDGSPSTRKRIKSRGESETVLNKSPNLRQSPISQRHAAGGGLQAKWDRRGYKTPEELGFKPFCQMRDCWSQDVHQTKVGTFCTDQHAQLIAADFSAQPLEVLRGEKRAKQLAAQVI